MSAAIQRPRSVRQFVRGIFLDDLRNKGTAVLLALMIWGVAFNNTEGTETLTLAVKISAPADAIIVATRVANEETEFTKEVTLTIRGQRRDLEQIRESKTQYYGVFLVGELEKRVDLDVTDPYHFPTGVKVVHADPPAVDVDVEAKWSQDVFVQPNVIGDPRPPYRYDEDKVTVIPEKVRITGPRSQVEQVQVVVTELINLTDREGRIVEVVSLRAPSLEFVELDPEGQLVEVTLDLDVAVKQRDLAVPIRFSIPQDHDVWAIVPVAFSLTFEGPPEALVVLEQRIDDGHVWGNIRVPDDKLGEEVHNPSFQHGDVRFLEGMLPSGVVVVDSKPVGLLINYTMERHQ